METNQTLHWHNMLSPVNQFITTAVRRNAGEPCESEVDCDRGGVGEWELWSWGEQLQPISTNQPKIMPLFVSYGFGPVSLPGLPGALGSIRTMFF